jgi:hypothetical protein
MIDSIEIVKKNIWNHQRMLNDIQRTRLSRGRKLWHLAHPLPPVPSVSSTCDSEETEKERQLTNRRGGKGIGEEPNQTTTGKPGLL